MNTQKLIISACLGVMALLFIVPVVGVFLSSLKTTAEIAEVGLWSLPKSLNLDNFKEILSNPAIWIYLKNTVIISVVASIFSIILGALTGYVFAKIPFRFSNILFLAIIAGMFFPPQVILIPLFRLFNAIGLLDTLWPMIIVHTAMGIPICSLLMRNFFVAVPDSLREASILDGANELNVLVRIILPLSLPALSVLFILQFTWIWNDFLWPLIFTQSDDKRTVMLGLVSLKGQYSVAWGVQGALSFVASLPTLVVFLLFQRYFIKGMTMGAVKG